MRSIYSATEPRCYKFARNTGMRRRKAKTFAGGCRRCEPIDRAALAVLNVRGKGKFRELVAPGSVAEYIERIAPSLSRAQKVREPKTPDKDLGRSPMISSSRPSKANPQKPSYAFPLEDLLTKRACSSGPLAPAAAPIPFRHTYATFRLMEGVDVYFLAKQMGTSVKMIEDFYGHITRQKMPSAFCRVWKGWATAGRRIRR